MSAIQLLTKPIFLKDPDNKTLPLAHTMVTLMYHLDGLYINLLTLIPVK